MRSNGALIELYPALPTRQPPQLVEQSLEGLQGQPNLPVVLQVRLTRKGPARRQFNSIAVYSVTPASFHSHDLHVIFNSRYNSRISNLSSNATSVCPLADTKIVKVLSNLRLKSKKKKRKNQQHSIPATACAACNHHLHLHTTTQAQTSSVVWLPLSRPIPSQIKLQPFKADRCPENKVS